MSPSWTLTEIESCASTQDEARERLIKSGEDFVAVRAEKQSRGRGRQDREWVSPAGNLFLSLGFRIDPSVARPWPFVSLLTGMAAARSLENLGCWDSSCFVKWPNDLYRLQGKTLAKIGGILTELRKDILLVGIGINVETAPEIAGPYATTSLKNIALKPPTASQLAQILSSDLKSLIEAWIASPKDISENCIRELSSLWMKHFFSMTGEVEGMGRVRVLGLLHDGRLSVHGVADPNQTRIVSSGEFSLLPEPTEL
ncbi:MAG: biotin--[acetyl-CoA-carboxylase] ligase [Bdellovibrionota bacterium]